MAAGCRATSPRCRSDADVLAYEQFAGSTTPRAISNFVLEAVASKRIRVAPLDTSLWRSLHSRLTEDADAPLTL
jgi:hypothetical protein